MATSEKLLSQNDGEALEAVEANKEDGKVQHVGGPESDWTTANYANFKFDATLGVSPASKAAAVPAETAEPLKEEEVAAEKDDEKKDEVMSEEAPPEEVKDAEQKKDDVMSEADEMLAQDDSEKKDDVMSEADDELMLSADDEANDEEVLELDLSDLVDDEGEVVELSVDDTEIEISPEDEEDVEPVDAVDEFVPADELDTAEDNLAVEISDEEDEELVDEAEEMPADEKKDEVMSEADEDEDKKDEMMSEEDDEDMSDEKKKDAEPMAEGKLKISFKMDEAKKLFENNTVLTEADKRQSRALFESAVRSVAKQMGQQLQEAYQARFEKVKAQHEAKVAQQVDQYLSYVVEQWSKDNKVALQNQLRNRLSDSFIAGLQKLCTEHYIEVPQSKVNVVEALAKNVKTLKTRLKESEAKNVKLHNESRQTVARERAALRKEHTARLIAEAASAVTSVDRGAFVDRANTLKFTSTKEFKKNLIALREQYFGAKTSTERSTNEPVAVPAFETKQAPSPVDIYTKAADRLTLRS